jgi:hypothetical protein
MQGGCQVIRFDQKRLDEIKRMREALTAGKPVFTDQEKADIVKYAVVLGVDGEAIAEKHLIQVRELADQLVAAMRMVKEYFSKLCKRAALHGYPSILRRRWRRRGWRS